MRQSQNLFPTKNLKIKSIYSLVLLGVAILLVTACKKKDTNSGVTDLLTDATEYTGTYPAPAKINYVVQGKSLRLTAFPGQIIAFFKMTASQADASQLIAANGGSILAKIPSVGYYFIGIDSSQTS
jgi:hypothetical protein